MPRQTEGRLLRRLYGRSREVNHALILTQTSVGGDNRIMIQDGMRIRGQVYIEFSNNISASQSLRHYSILHLSERMLSHIVDDQHHASQWSWCASSCLPSRAGKASSWLCSGFAGNPETRFGSAIPPGMSQSQANLIPNLDNNIGKSEADAETSVRRTLRMSKPQALRADPPPTPAPDPNTERGIPHLPVPVEINSGSGLSELSPDDNGNARTPT